MLCNRSASFTKSTRMSSMEAKSMRRNDSAWAASLAAYDFSSVVILVSAFTRLVTSSPNWLRSSSSVT